MADPLDSLRCLIHRPSDAVRWACLLEAMAPKAGNVYPGRTFSNLAYVDFVAAAEITAKRIGRSKRPMSERMLRAVEQTVALTKTNVNLGIVLLLGPLVAADEVLIERGRVERTDQDWASAIAEVLNGFSGVDGQNIYGAIDGASAGALGEVDSLDVHQTNDGVDIVAAMRLGEDRDRIARQYASGFADLITQVVPVVWDSIVDCGDVLSGVSRAHLRLLRAEPDSLIARKNGVAVAITVQKRAQKVDLENPASIAKFDDSLRSNAHKLNPGTTADLIAAALYLLLRTPTQ